MKTLIRIFTTAVLGIFTATAQADTTLTQDEDWSGQEATKLTGTINLNGHNLTVSQLSGTCTITDTSVAGGELRVNCASNFTKPATVAITGSLKLVKDGAGTLTWGGGTLAAATPILVTNGVFKLGVTTENVFGSSGTIIVKGKGQFDLNFSNIGKNSPVLNKTFEIEGDGPDGSGAIVNSSANNNYGYHLSKVILTGDATIGGTSCIDFRGANKNRGIDGGGHTLTIKNKKQVCITENGNYLKNCKDVVISDGGKFQPCTGCTISGITGAFVLQNGTFGSYASKNVTETYRVPFIIGAGGGTIRSDNYWYSLWSTVTVKDGGTLTWSGGPWCNCDITNAVDSTIRTSGEISISGKQLVRNDGLFEVTGGTFYFGHRDNSTTPCRIENGGTIRLSGGTLNFKSESSATGAGVFEVKAGAANLNGDLTGFTGTIRLNGGTTTIGKLSGFKGTLSLNGGTLNTNLSGFEGDVEVDLRDRQESFKIDTYNWCAYLSGRTVTLNLAGRTLKKGDMLLNWNTYPNANFVLDPETAAAGIDLLVLENGVFYGADPNSREAVTATWKAGSDGLFLNPANWTCLNAAEREIPDGLPGAETLITLQADVTNGAWRDFPIDTFKGIIEMNGYAMALYGKQGESAGTFTVRNTAGGDPAPLALDIDEGVAFVNKTIAFSGNVALVKTGAGSLTWGGGAFATTNPILITNGVFKLGAGLGQNVFGSSGTIIVKDKGQFDINYSVAQGPSPVLNKVFEIEGDGPDGSGAIINSAAGNNWGYHLSEVVLTGDATIGGTMRIDFRGASRGIDGGGHTLTIKNKGLVCFADSGSYLKNCKDVVITEGGRFQPCTGCTISDIAGAFILQNGTFSSYAAKNATELYRVPFVIGADGGTIRSDNYYYTLYNPVTVKDGGTLAWNGAPWGWCFTDVTNTLGSTIRTEGEISMAGHTFRNEGLFELTKNTFHFGHRDTSASPCRIENDGTIRTSGGTLNFKSESSATGAGAFEVTGGTANLNGDLTGFTGTIRLNGGTTSIGKIAGFTGALVLSGGSIASGTSLANFTGPATIDVSGCGDALSVDNRNWFTFASGKRVFVDVGDRELQYGEKLISWTTPPPDGIRFALSTKKDGILRRTDTGITYVKSPGLMLIFR